MNKIEDIIHFNPLITDPKYGHEPSLKELLVKYYTEHDIEPSKALVYIDMYVEQLQQAFGE